MQLYRTSLISIVGLALVTFCGCGQSGSPAPKMGGFPTPEVGVVTVRAQALPMVTEFPGRVDAVRTAQVRARATGILLKRAFDEGADVKAGDILFQIDPAPLQANLDSVSANLAKAEATLGQAKSREARFKSLVEVNAVSRQEYDDTASAVKLAEAEIAAAKAAVATAKLNLGYATVTAPIDGRIGEAKVTEGSLVSQVEATQLAVIQQLDPIYVDFPQSSTELLRLKKSLDSGKLQSVDPLETKVTLILEDGSTYAATGKLLFSDVTVDPSTGMVTMRSEFPNPDHVLLPGMFARVQLQQAINNDAITVLQRGVALGANGGATAMVATPDSKVELRNLKLGNAVGDKWVVIEGLKVGDKVIVEGLQKVRPGGDVKTVPFDPTANSAEPQPPSAGK